MQASSLHREVVDIAVQHSSRLNYTLRIAEGALSSVIHSLIALCSVRGLTTWSVISNVLVVRNSGVGQQAIVST